MIIHFALKYNRIGDFFMADEKKLAQAKATFETLCQTLANNDWKCKVKDEEKLIIECGAQGEDLPMDISVRVDPDRMLVILLSRLPFVTKEDKRLDVAVAVSAVNNMLVDGSFDYDITSGDMYYRMTNSFMESVISEEVFAYLLYASCNVIDDFNDKFLMLAKGMITLEQFLATLSK